MLSKVTLNYYISFVKGIKSDCHTDSMCVERILVKKANSNYIAIKKACYAARVVYNCANYSLRQSFFQAEDGIRHVAPSRGLGDVYKRQR